MRYLLVGIAVLTGCLKPRSSDFVCSTTDDCEAGRVCEVGFCVVDQIDAAKTPIDARPVDAMPDATITQMFPIASDCDGSRCTGGRNGQKNASGPPTADKLCLDRAFPRSIDFTISNNQPGGRFCTFNPGTQTFDCDPSCSGCNPITSVTCRNP